ncbi:MAG: dihydroneopterin triphosphate diphosphatase [Candidatus Competibacteraceae bacterium]|nr:dihydroneopterin triphosphate diphosphatase [Candidatus Competibacteraceae bacterium]
MNATVYKRPESVLVLIYTTAREFLLMRRVRPAAFWQSVTGSMDWDETDPLTTAYRELAEETGIIAPAGAIIDCHMSQQFPIKPAWRHRYPADVQFNTEHVFRLELPERLPIILNPAEHTDYLWLPRDQALAKVTSYTNRDAILALT